MKAKTATALAVAVFLTTSIAAMAQKSGAKEASAAKWSMYGGVDEKSLPSAAARERPTQKYYKDYLEQREAKRQERIDGYNQQYEERIAVDKEAKAAKAAETAAGRGQQAVGTQGIAQSPIPVQGQPGVYTAQPQGTPVIGSDADRERYYRPELGYPYTSD